MKPPIQMLLSEIFEDWQVEVLTERSELERIEEEL